MLKKILEWIEKQKLKKDLRTISGNDVWNIVNDEFDNPRVNILDSKYKVPRLEYLKHALSKTAIDRARYVSDLYDCDNFAFHLHSVLALEYHINSVGIVISGASRHAFNIVIAHEGGKEKVYKLEPQADRLWRPEKPERDKYVVSGELILI